MPRNSPSSSRVPIETVADIVRTYIPASTDSPPKRLADFLKHVASALPETFVERKYAAKVAFAMPKTPKEDADCVKDKLPTILGNVRNRLQKDHGMTLVIDRCEGIRATFSNEDIVRTEHRRKRHRVVSAINSFETVDGLVEADKVKSQKLRDELNRARESMKLLQSFKTSVPLLPPGSK